MDANEPLRKCQHSLPPRTVNSLKLNMIFFKFKKKVLNIWTFLFLPGFLPHYDQCLQDNMKKEGIN